MNGSGESFVQVFMASLWMKGSLKERNVLDVGKTLIVRKR